MSFFLGSWDEMRWIGCLTSQLTIFQSYLWRHIDVEADRRRSSENKSERETNKSPEPRSGSLAIFVPRSDSFSVLGRFVCSVLRFIPHEPRKMIFIPYIYNAFIKDTLLTGKERLVSELTRSYSWALDTNWNSLCVYNGQTGKESRLHWHSFVRV